MRFEAVVVVGDGESDRIAAANNGCVFFRVSAARGLAAVARELERADV